MMLQLLFSYCVVDREFVEVKEFSIPDMHHLWLSLFLLGSYFLERIGVVVDQNGKLNNDGRICWSEAPASVVIHFPYAIARLPRYVEIRSLRAPYPLVQTVALRDVRLLIQSNNYVIAALENYVHGLLAVPLGAQIIQLTASGNFEEALLLCKLLPLEVSNLRAAKESSIHIRYGHYLFDNGSYEEAMEQFLASSVDITYFLSLYPSIVIPKLLAVSEPEKVADFGADTAHLSRGSSDASDEMESSSPSQLVESDEKSALELKKMSHNALMGLVKFLQKKEMNRGHMHVSSSAREMATILDTALIQALLLTGQSSAALELLKGPNYCDVKICEEFLRQRNHYLALLELSRCNEMHREALRLLNQLVEESHSEQPKVELTQKFKPEMIIVYLKPLCSTDPMLVLEFSLFALESCPTQTIELFWSGNLPAELVNSYLKQHAPNMQAKYLELMLAMNENSVSTNLQNELVQIYLSEVLDWYSDLKSQQKWDEKTSSPTRKKLLSALEGISAQNAELVLKRLPSDALYEERVILLGKINQHQLALSLYVHKLYGDTQGKDKGLLHRILTNVC
ncbi:hypothetical protein MRB53_004330 [Persea americana]|uniref:Uncharacterized protein n=1 Tax=Persea americana TaxID=3435 RepID=A0ACC2M9X3_PERAE|nr:hypothetical protein MRB53_004330 [Persea americana]